jgi:hypothetical protein
MNGRSLSLWERRAFGYSLGAMGHRLLLSLLAILALTMVAVSLVWPQGMGRQLPPPFGGAAQDSAVASR